MKRLLINADAGEGAAGSPLDLALLGLVDALNIALGGHAGNPAWSRELAARASAAGLAVHLHPGYPDREHFGRRELALPWDELATALSRQRAVLPQVTTCKFHGALYNRAAADHELAAQLVDWCRSEDIDQVLAPPESAMAVAAAAGGLRVLREGFADRAYVSGGGLVTLADRDQPGAIHHELGVALAQAQQIATSATVTVLDGRSHPLPCDTLCLHGDGALARDLAQGLRTLFADAGPVLRLREGTIRIAGASDPSRLHLGHSPGGAHDRWSQARANALLGNHPQAGVAEGLLGRLRLRVERACHLVVGGRPGTLRVDGTAAERWTVLALTPGSELEIDSGPLGCRSVIALAGGAAGEGSEIFAADPAALTRGAAGSRLPLTPARPAWAAPLGVIRMLPGPEATPARIEALAGSWRVGAQSNGVGLRLEGPTLPGTDFDIPSSPVVDGTVQASAKGPIILLRERGTLGGYPRIARVIAPDLDVCAQIQPGQVLRVEVLSVDEAAALEAAWQAELDALDPA